ncbi:MAG TPA: hypothetical protein VGM25_01625 [Caulobacteraceae bacterium]
MLGPIFACLFNCAPAVVVTVESHAKAAPAAGTQVLLRPFDPRISATDPTYLYVAKVVSKALEQKGLKPVQAAGDGLAVVEIEWSQDGAKIVTRTLQAPETGGSFRTPPAGPQGTVYGMGGGPNEAGMASTRDARPGGLGTDDSRVQKLTRYPWTIALKGLSPAGPASPPLWTVSASGDSVSQDPADIVPEMIAASLPLLGADSVRKDVRVSASDASVKSISPPPGV